MNRKHWWHCRGPFLHEWGYNDAFFVPMRGCLRDGCDRTEWDYDLRRMKEREERSNAPCTEAVGRTDGGQ